MARPFPEHLVIPVETLNREFDGKLLLALCAAERGFRPIFGGRTSLHRRASSLPTSIYVSKGIRVGNRAMLSLLQRMGHVIVALEEEGLIRHSDEAYLMMLDPSTFNRATLLYAWGHDNAELWRRFRDYRDTPIIEAGNPRMDLLRPEIRNFYRDDVKALHERFGKFVLFNSNFSFVNHFIPGLQRFRVAEQAPSDRSDAIKAGIKQHKAAVFESFIALLPKLSAAVAPHGLVVRPHPSENAQTWKDVTAGLPNVHVIHEGPVVPWLMAASALIHNSCTSGIEAAILGTPALSYRAVRSNEFDPELPNVVSSQYTDPESLCAAARAALDGSHRDRDLTGINRAHLEPHITALDGKLSCEIILDALVDNRDRIEAVPIPSSRERLEGHIGLVAQNARRVIKTRMKGRSSATYSAHKFPPLEHAFVVDRINRFKALLGRFEGLQARRWGPDIFTIERG